MDFEIDINEILNQIRHKKENDLDNDKNSWLYLKEFMKIITNNTKIRDQKSLLASHAFFKINAEIHSDIFHQVQYILQQTTNIKFLNESFDILDSKCFQLTFIHGYLLVINESLFNYDDFISCFQIIEKHCIIYTPYTYFAFKVLKEWLTRSVYLKFWSNNEHNNEIENRLETIIFSNWDNSINDVAKLNNSQLFAIYLKIMEDKYHGYIEYVFSTCSKQLSWASTKKFTILTEVCKVWNSIPQFENHEIKEIIESLTRSQLKHVSTKFYLSLLNKLDETQWTKYFLSNLILVFTTWEQEGKMNALQLLWDLWMKPTLNKFRNDSGLLSKLCLSFCKEKLVICQSYLARISIELNISWNDVTSLLFIDERNRIIHEHYLFTTHNEENIRLNIITYHCNIKETYEIINFEIIKRFLYYNVKTTSVKLRKGIFNNIEILIDRISNSPWTQQLSEFIYWLIDFILDCLEPGSCYQRKIIGLKLYEIILMSANRKLTTQKPNSFYYRVTQYAGKWKLNNKKSLLILLRLCLDPIEEIREVASKIIKNFFDMTILLPEEINSLTSKAIEMNKSLKFYELTAGVKLLLLISQVPSKNNFFYHDNPQNLYEYLLKNAQSSFDLMKKDFLKALANECNFNASLIAILQLGSNNNSMNSFQSISVDYFTRLLDLLEEATVFFLSALSPKSSNISYSSSFAEMAVAIEELIKSSVIKQDINNAVVTPAHQAVISTIWMALKTISELCAKISTLSLKFDELKRSVDLITSILMKCRHKGAIEAAGSALAESMRHLTKTNKFDHVFDTYLDKLLNLNSNDQINLTRRGAGFSIMFLNIISNDKKRRIIHIAIKKILNSLNDSDNSINTSSKFIDSNQDSPQARLLHFLRCIVADKSLLEDLIFYIEDIALVAVSNLQSSEWAIRNASLQLLGAVIPRIVGQTGENELIFGTGYLINHFITHYPTLAALILKSLSHENDFKTTNILVPLLIMLSKMSVDGTEFTDYSSKEYVDKLKIHLQQLFSHPVEHVRFLAAKTYAALIPMNYLVTELANINTKNDEKYSKNYIHGNLLSQISIIQMIEYKFIFLKNMSTYDNKIIRRIFENKIKRSAIFISNWNEYHKNEKPINYVIEAAFLQSIVSFPLLNDDKILQSFEFGKYSTYLIHKLIMFPRQSTYKEIGYFELFYQFLKIGIRMNFIPNESILSSFWKFCSLYNCHERIENNFWNYFSKLIDKVYKYDKHRMVNYIYSTFDTITKDDLNDNEIMEYLKAILNIIRISKDNILSLWTRPLFMKNFFLRLDSMIQKSKFKKIHLLCRSLLVLILNQMKPCSRHCQEIKDKFYSRLCNTCKCLIHFDDIIDAVYDLDVERRKWAIDSLKNLDLCNLDFSFKRRIIEPLIKLVSDENEEIRTLFCKDVLERKKLYNIRNFLDKDQFEEIFSDKYIEPQFESNYLQIPEYYFHQVINVTIILQFYCSIKFNDFPDSNYILDLINKIVQKSQNYQILKKEIESPFDHDETYFECTKFLNIYFSLNSQYYPYFIGSLITDIKYNDIIETGNLSYEHYITARIQKGKSLEIDNILNIQTNEYVNFKWSSNCLKYKENHHN
ncbi:uncharacterized protein [Chelonus insularis]|uniref:uncharacterized protein n=1 Tax=Chelonus insularis TaxID=460826 RepID=UPI00158EE3A2|nr:uncharacterized protein LOC118071921 [Chelonus insularis]